VVLPLLAAPACDRSSAVEASRLAEPGSTPSGRGPVSEATLRLESLYWGNRLRLEAEGLPVRSVSLEISQISDMQMAGTLRLDPNICTLDEFGDRQGCTRIGVRTIDVTIRRTTLPDPTSLMRRRYEVIGEGLPRGLALVLQGEPDDDDDARQRSYLVFGAELVPLYVSEPR